MNDGEQTSPRMINGVFIFGWVKGWYLFGRQVSSLSRSRSLSHSLTRTHTRIYTWFLGLSAFVTRLLFWVSSAFLHPVAMDI